MVVAGLLSSAVALVLTLAHSTHAQTLPRDFALPTPLFAPESAWNQAAVGAAVLPESDRQMLTLYRVLLGDTAALHPSGTRLPNPFPFLFVSHDNFSVAVFRLGGGQQTVLVRTYEGTPARNNPKLPVAPDGTVTVPAPAGTVRPPGPEGRGADGHLVLFDPLTSIEYDFWQPTTVRDAAGQSLGGGRAGRMILDAGAVDVFDARGPGANPPTYASARATGTPLLAGMILPEDIERGVISHALAFSIPGPRNTNTADPSAPLASDYFYPASSTEVGFYSTNPSALAAGQRIRLRRTIVGTDGMPIDEARLLPITRMLLAALRTYGAYLVDNSGAFSLTAEDIHTAVLHLTNDQVNALIGQSPGRPLPAGKTKWQVVIETLNQELENIPIAAGPRPPGQDPATATIDIANFEVVSPATVSPAPALPSARVALSGSQFRAGQTLTLSVVVTNPGAARAVDAYLGVQLADGRTTLYFTGGGFVPTMTPLARAFPLASGVVLGPVPALSSTLPAMILAGTYTFLFTLTDPGSPGAVVASGSAPATFQP